MKKQVWRHKELARFSLNIEELRAFCSALSQEFDKPDDVSVSVHMKLPGGVSLKFESIEEMVEEMAGPHSSTPDVINNYTIRIHGGEQYVSIGCRPWESRATISVSSEKEGWCAGVVEAASSAMRKHQVWHRWIPRWSFWALVCLIPVIYLFWKGRWDETVSLFELVGIVAIYLVGYRMIFLEERIFPVGAIRVREKENFIRRNSTEITVVIGLIGAVALIIRLFTH